jgi:hypothetical protein
LLINIGHLCQCCQTRRSRITRSQWERGIAWFNDVQYLIHTHNIVDLIRRYPKWERIWNLKIRRCRWEEIRRVSNWGLMETHISSKPLELPRLISSSVRYSTSDNHFKLQK